MVALDVGSIALMPLVDMIAVMGVSVGVSVGVSAGAVVDEIIAGMERALEVVVGVVTSEVVENGVEAVPTLLVVMGSCDREEGGGGKLVCIICISVLVAIETTVMWLAECDTYVDEGLGRVKLGVASKLSVE